MLSSTAHTAKSRLQALQKCTMIHSLSCLSLINLKIFAERSQKPYMYAPRHFVTTRSGRRSQAAKAVDKEGIHRQQMAILFKELVAGTESMLDGSGNLRVEHNNDETPGGVIRIWSSSDGNQPVLAFAAPKIDGIHMYTWVDAQQMWCSKADGHFLKEILARELVYWCKGFPTF